jgi:hypothetical protein
MKRLIPALSLIALVAATPALAEELVSAPGKHDLTELPDGFAVTPIELPAWQDVAASLPAHKAKEDEIFVVPASYSPSDPLGFVRYNLQKIDVSDFSGAYGAGQFADQSKAVIWDVGIAYGLTTYFGMKAWGWGDNPFHFENEGWFGGDTKYGGMDKVAHAYSAYLFSEYFTQRIAHETDNRDGAFITGALLGFSIQAYVEFFDGFAGGHGFSYEDMISNGVGAGFSALRSAIPELGEKLDFRLEYVPSGEQGFAPVLDYEGQKYLLALKLSGFDQFEDTPLRFLELHAGYYARGFSDEARDNGVKRSRDPYIGIGINLNELLQETPVADTTAGLAASRFFEYVQVPYTYAATSQD